MYDSSGDSWTPFTPNADGTYTLSDSQVDLSAANNLAVKLAANDSQEFNVSVSVTEQEGDATPSSPVVQTFSVTVAEVSDNATLAFMIVVAMLFCCDHRSYCRGSSGNTF